MKRRIKRLTYQPIICGPNKWSTDPKLIVESTQSMNEESVNNTTKGCQSTANTNPNTSLDLTSKRLTLNDLSISQSTINQLFASEMSGNMSVDNIRSAEDVVNATDRNAPEVVSNIDVVSASNNKTPDVVTTKDLITDTEQMAPKVSTNIDVMTANVSQTPEGVTPNDLSLEVINNLYFSNFNSIYLYI